MSSPRSAVRSLLGALLAVLVASAVLPAAGAQAAEPVPPVSDLTARAGDKVVGLSWTMPAAPAGLSLVVRRAQGSTPPAAPTEGLPVYDGPAATSVTASGLTNGQTYAFSVWTRDSSGAVSSPVSTRAIPVPPPDTTLSLMASPTTLTFPDWTTLVGRLVRTDTGAGIAAVTVDVWRRSPSGSWAWSDTLTTDDQGYVRSPRRPWSSTDFQLRHVGTPYSGPAVSPALRISVRPQLTAKLSATAVRVARTATISGKLAPAHPGARVYLQRYSSGAWRDVASKQLSSTSTFTFSVTPGSAGWWSYRVRRPADSNHASGVVTLPRLEAYRLHTYVVRTRGTIKADMDKFRAVVAATYADSRGWRRAHHRFKRVSTGGSFTVLMAEAKYLPTYSSVCSTMWSCRAGRYVIINQNRWRFGSPYFTGSLAQYRQMVINHETGHWLGSGHAYCSGSGQLAPVMQQQSKGMQGCLPNAWPLDWEIRKVS